jgi:hypothetical protein
MHDHGERRGPSPALLLLIPAALILAKGAKRRRAMWAAGGPWGPTSAGFGHHHGFSGAGDPRGAFRLPPWIEQALDAWHSAAHASSDATGPDASTGTATV